jgi:adenine phosphoribosyltransferase
MEIGQIISKLRHIPDFPKEGINFVDITTVLQDGDAFRQAIDLMKEKILGMGDFDIITGTESRGFIFGAPLAYALGKGFVLVRKKGKLPYNTIREEYQLEYGSDVLEIHEDAIQPGQKVVIIDDLLATGGTTLTNIKLVEKLGGEVAGIIYFIELTELGGRDYINSNNNYRIDSLIKI